MKSIILEKVGPAASFLVQSPAHAGYLHGHGPARENSRKGITHNADINMSTLAPGSYIVKIGSNYRKVNVR